MAHAASQAENNTNKKGIDNGTMPETTYRTRYIKTAKHLNQ
jgi:hypothetical protein